MLRELLLNAAHLSMAPLGVSPAPPRGNRECFISTFACFLFWRRPPPAGGADLLPGHGGPSDVCASSCQMFFFPPCSVFPPLYLPLTLSFCLHSHCIHQILDSVSYTHQHDIVHRDLKVCVRVSLICICVCLSAASPAGGGGALRGWKGGVALLMLVFNDLFSFFFFSFSCL